MIAGDFMDGNLRPCKISKQKPIGIVIAGDKIPAVLFNGWVCLDVPYDTGTELYLDNGCLSDFGQYRIGYVSSVKNESGLNCYSKVVKIELCGFLS